MEKGTSYEGRSANRTASSDADGATYAAQIEEENSDSDADDATSAAQMEEENSDNDADGATSAAQMEEENSDNDGDNNNSGTDGHYDRWSDDDDEEYGYRSDDDADAADAAHGEEDSSSDDDDNDYDISGPDGEDDKIFYDNNVFNVMGSVKEKRYQDALERVQELMAKEENVPLRVERDPDNIQDKNALIVEAFVDQSWKNVGTIQKRKIPKLTRALRQGTVGSYRFAGSPQYKLNVYKSGLHGQTCQLITTNKGRWDDDDRTYYYDKDLSHL